MLKQINIIILLVLPFFLFLTLLIISIIIKKLLNLWKELFKQFKKSILLEPGSVKNYNYKHFIGGAFIVFIVFILIEIIYILHLIIVIIDAVETFQKNSKIEDYSPIFEMLKQNTKTSKNSLLFSEQMQNFSKTKR